MANEEKELYKFVNDPKYRSKVIAKIHKNSDNAYNKRIKKIEHERDALSKKRTREITRIANDRWESLAGGSIGEKYRSIIQRSYFRAFGVRK